MVVKEIPKSKRPYIGFFLNNGLSNALTTACKKLETSKSEFVRFSLMKVLSEYSIISEEIKKNVDSVE